MKFICLLPVRDEADIISQSLTHLLCWADAIYVFDTGSVDETWEIVCDMAQLEKRIIPIKKDPVFFNETLLRGWMFHHARQSMRNGDWFLRVDADEFHHITPQEFIKTRLNSHETIVYHQYYTFCLLQSEVQSWFSGDESKSDRLRPIEDRRRWYQVESYSEPRLCMYRESMKWPSHVSFPYNAGFVASERFPIRHYPHRDPLQLQRRCQLRAIMMSSVENSINWSSPETHHWIEREWRKFVIQDNSKGLNYWSKGKELTEIHQYNHLAPPLKRLAQRLTHAALLPFLDLLRPSWQETTYPLSIPPSIQEYLIEQMKNHDEPSV